MPHFNLLLAAYILAAVFMLVCVVVMVASTYHPLGGGRRYPRLNLFIHYMPTIWGLGISCTYLKGFSPSESPVDDIGMPTEYGISLHVLTLQLTITLETGIPQ